MKIEYSKLYSSSFFKFPVLVTLIPVKCRKYIFVKHLWLFISTQSLVIKTHTHTHVVNLHA